MKTKEMLKLEFELFFEKPYANMYEDAKQILRDRRIEILINL